MQKSAANKISVLWFFIHFALEVICFQFYNLYFGSLAAAALMALVYDTLAFFPQFFIGALSESRPKLPTGPLGACMVLLGGCTAFFGSTPLRTAGLLVLSLGNAFVHVGGAKATLYTCDDKIAPSAVFVAGGSFGVITGKMLGVSGISIFAGLIVMLGGSVLMHFADRIYSTAKKQTPRLHMADTRRNTAAVIMLAFFVVSVRGLLGYGLPTAWNSTPLRGFLLFCMMGVGKALGGILSDRFGAKKTALISTGLSLPLLLLGDNNMWISLAGIALFSMTMSSTLGILVSAVPEHPLMAYGVTTTGLLAGTLPAGSARVMNIVSRGSFLSVLTAVCFAALWYIMANDNTNKRKGNKI